MYKFVKAVQLNKFMSEDVKSREVEKMQRTGNIFFDKKKFFKREDEGKDFVSEECVFDVYDNFFIISRK